MTNQNLLDELYQLVLKEEENVLSEVESVRYVEIVEYLHEQNVAITFGINV